MKAMRSAAKSKARGLIHSWSTVKESFNRESIGSTDRPCNKPASNHCNSSKPPSWETVCPTKATVDKRDVESDTDKSLASTEEDSQGASHRSLLTESSQSQQLPEESPKQDVAALRVEKELRSERELYKGLSKIDFAAIKAHTNIQNSPSLQQASAAAAHVRPAHHAQLAHARALHQYSIGTQYHIVDDLHFAVHKDANDSVKRIDLDPHCFFWSTCLHDKGYLSFCDDFGPNRMSQVIAFAKKVKKWVSHFAGQNRTLVYYSFDNERHVTNAVFLLAAYLVLERNYTPEQAWKPFKVIADSLVSFRDASFQKQDFDLTILDCLKGLHRAIKLSWLDHGNFDLVEYEMYGNPYGADLTKVCTKFIAMRGPSSTFWASCYADILKKEHVTAVVRLNRNEYEAESFTEAGIEHHEMYFPDCSTPDDDTVEKFMDVCSSTDGVVAVHCMAGLGRTGTLIALYIMKHYEFTANEAIAFLRIMRPGCVIGSQQHYLQECAERGWVGNRLGPMKTRNKAAHPTRDYCRQVSRQISEVVAARSSNVSLATLHNTLAQRQRTYMLQRCKES